MSLGGGARRADAGATDSGATDAGAADSGATDAGAADAGATDAGATDAGATDAGLPSALSCARDPLPTSVAPGVTNVTVAGTVFRISPPTMQPVADATVEAWPLGSDAPVATANTGMDGRYAIAIPLSDTPFTGTLRFSADGFHLTELYPAHPLDGRLGVDMTGSFQAGGLYLLTDADWTTLQGDLAQLANRGFGQVFMIDCDGMPATGLTVSTDVPSELNIVYVDGTGSSPTPSSETSAALLVNAPTDRDVQVTVDYGAFTVRRMIRFRPGVSTYIVFTPRGALAGG